MADVIKNYSDTGSSEGSGVGIILGVLVAIILIVLFFVYGLPRLRNQQAAPQNGSLDVNVQLPASGSNTGTSGGTSSPAPSPSGGYTP